MVPDASICLRRPDLDGIQRQRTTARYGHGRGWLPVALVVSMFSCSERRPIPRACNVSTVDRSWRMDRARREPGDDQHITLAGERQGGGKLRPIGVGAAHRFLKHPLAPGGMEGVDLTVSGLQIGRDPRIADQHRKSPKTRHTPEQSRRGFQNLVPRSCMVTFRTEPEPI